MNRNQLIISLFLLTILSACTKKNTSIKDLYQQDIVTNTVYSSESIKDNPNDKYAFYLPSSYNGKTRLPVIYILDPHANGALPVEKYTDIAEKQQVILIASSTIKNGMQQNENQTHFNNLLSETKQRFVFDYNQQFIAGFSGGAKLSILFASQKDEIKGVIACGGTMPFVQYYKPNFYFSGVVGVHDFNYLEMAQSQSIFNNSGLDFTSVKFYGGHEWPPTESFDLAVAGLKLFAMKNKLANNNKKWIKSLYKQINDSIDLYNETKQLIKEYEALKQTKRWFYNVKPLNNINKRILVLENNAEFKKQIKEIQAYAGIESTLRGNFIRAIDGRNLTWWKSEAEKIKNPKIPNKEAINANNRIRNYISMICYMKVADDLKNKRLDLAFNKIQIYELIDENNADVYLMYANYYRQREDKKLMLSSFKKAMSLKQINTDQYIEDKLWSALFSEPKIIELLK